VRTGNSPWIHDKPKTDVEELFLLHEKSGSDNESHIYCKNNTDETLVSVTSQSGGFETCDEDLVCVTGEEIIYKDVLPGESVLVEKYDNFYDTDYVLGVSLTVESPAIGKRSFYCSEKGGVRNQTLLYSDLQCGRCVGMELHSKRSPTFEDTAEEH
jgi:hypothetical protein